ncbi:MAG: SGNH/GDSL hydrolase family protein [Verrucomicrobiales bacterium]|nr:SGNH/GDSL hydrolase family protein [Verrucomicrobiales bacterium]
MMRNRFRIANLVLAVAIVVAWILPIEPAEAHPLTSEQRARLKKFLPRTFPKLQNREHVHVVALGDSVTLGLSPIPEENGNSLTAYSGVFLDRLAKEFFYPGSVRLLNPPNGQPEKLEEHLGQELWFENLSKGGWCMFDSIQRLSTSAFLHNPDLLIVNFGINDAYQHVSHYRYRQALQLVIDTCKANRTDIIVMSPTLVNLGEGEIQWGITRPYASVAKEVCEENGVLFVDIGQQLSRWGGAQSPGTEPQLAMEVVSDRLHQIVNHDAIIDRPDPLHLTRKAHEFAGLAAFDLLMNGPTPSDYSVTATAEFINDQQIKVQLSLRNQSRLEKQGTIGALALGNLLIPEDSSVAFVLGAGKNKQIEFIYNRPVVGTYPDGSPQHRPWLINDSEIRLSYILTDDEQTEILEPANVKLAPLTTSWPRRFLTDMTPGAGKLRIEWTFESGSTKTVAGKYRIGLGDIIGNPTSFTLPPLGKKNFFANFDFLPGADVARLQRTLFVEVEIDGVKFRFDREVEAVRDLVLGQTVALSPAARYGIGKSIDATATLLPGRSGMTFRADADANALFMIVDLENLTLVDLGDEPAVTVEVTLDARSQDRVRKFGFAAPIRVKFPARDGPGKTDNMNLGTFGSGYNKRLDPIGIPSVLKTQSGGNRRIEIRIPREYLFLHEWQLGSADSIFGLNVNVFLSSRDPQTGRGIRTLEGRYVLTYPTINYNGQHIAGIYHHDAQALQTLRLSRNPVNTWSVRIY